PHMPATPAWQCRHQQVRQEEGLGDGPKATERRVQACDALRSLRVGLDSGLLSSPPSFLFLLFADSIPRRSVLPSSSTPACNEGPNATQRKLLTYNALQLFNTVYPGSASWCWS